jgi:integrase
MASVYRKNGRWYLKYRTAAGRWTAHPSTASTKTEAKRLALELERKVERQRLGLEALPGDCTLTLGQLCEWWLDNRCPESSESRERSRLGKHVIRQAIGQLPVPDVTAAALDDRFQAMKRAGLSATYINGLRRVLGTVFHRARTAKKYLGPSPIEETEPLPEPKRAYETLRLEEIPILLAHSPKDWVGVFATACYAGLRKGEIFGLRKTDIDLDLKIMVVARSYDNETTKGRRAEAIPIAEPLIPYLKAAIESSPSDFVFPGRDGKMRTEEADPHLALRRALGRAGLVTGWTHSCRRCKARGSPHVEEHPDGQLRTCSVCGMKLWPTPRPRPLRFHDLRHSTATILLRAGVPAHAVQRILRHSDVSVTTGIYGHLVVEDLRSAMDRLKTGQGT